ncbi:hypothetical protein A7M41_18000 [Acinetobacter baumannii]|nr:hypothetical protein A7M41_18000 [Acinetobacter baumannii]
MMAYLIFVASVGYFHSALVVLALPGQFVQYSFLLFSHQCLCGIIRSRQTVVRDLAADGSGGLTVSSAFGDRFGGEAGLWHLAGGQLENVSPESCTTETTFCRAYGLRFWYSARIRWNGVRVGISLFILVIAAVGVSSTVVFLSVVVAAKTT